MPATMTYAVSGMSCDHCAGAVAGELRGLAGVNAVSVDLVPGGVSRVTVTSDAPLREETVTVALSDAGDYQLARA